MTMSAATTAARETAIWRRALAETLWGRRGVVKSVHLWLAASLVLAFGPGGASARSVAACLRLVLAVACYCQATILANDLADRRGDAQAGKTRWIQRLSLPFALSVPCGLSAVGVVALLPQDGHWTALAAYLGALALGVLYSVRPCRFKERGILGPLAYALSTTLAFAVVPWAWLRGDWGTLSAAAPAVFLDKWVHLQFHQVVDHGADVASGARTFAVRLGLQRARGTLRWAARAASAWVLVVALVVGVRLRTASTVVPCVGLAGMAMLLAAWRRRRGTDGRRSALEKELAPYYLGLSYAAFRLWPLLLLGTVSRAAPAMWGAFGVAAATVLLETVHSSRYRYE